MTEVSVRRSVSKPPHPADGLTAHVELGDGAVSRILDPLSFEDGGMVWRLTYGNAEPIKYVAASVIESYDYLLSGAINMQEATRRLRLLRAARRQLCQREAP